MTGSVRIVQYGRVEHYAITTTRDGSPSVVDIDVIYEHERPTRFVIDHKMEIDMEQLNALFEVLKRIGFNLEGGET
jgi:hypothetical protein